MKKPVSKTIPVLIGAVLGFAPTPGLGGWEPNAKDRNAAIEAADLVSYFNKLTDCLNRQVPAESDQITIDRMVALLKDRAFISALAERQFMTKLWAPGGVENFNDFIKADSKNKDFLREIMSSSELLNALCLAQTPCAWHWRHDDSHHITPTMLEQWKQIFHADPESRKGLYLKLAVACVLSPPGTGTPGAGQAKVQSSVFDRYLHYRKAHAEGELFPSFDNFDIWELTRVVSSGASNDDLTWGREALNTWNPSMRQNENAVAMVSQVWRRGSPIPYHDYSCVAAGGGACGPRSSFGVFICQAFGIPAIGVGQPAHAAIAYRDMHGNWQIGQGRGWHVSKLENMSGPEFLEVLRDRKTGKFDQIEHLRWIAALIESPGPTPYQVPEHVMKRSGVRGVVPAHQYENPRADKVFHLYEQLPDSRGKIVETPFASRRADSVSALGRFEAPSNAGEMYFARVRGFVYPPDTGDYVFSITSDDDSDLFLSRDDKPDNMKLITSVQGWTAPTDFSRKSQPVKLEKGKRYYIEAVHRELDGGDHLAVAWQGPGVPEGVIAGDCLSPFPSGGKGGISREIWFDAKAPKTDATKPRQPRRERAPESPIQVAPGVIHVEAEDFFNHGNVEVMDCYTGGKQVYFPALTAHSWCGYKIKVPKTGTYRFTARVAAINWDQQLYVRSFGAMYPAINAKASEVYRNDVNLFGPQMAIDNDLSTRWAMSFGKDQGWIELDLGQPREISKIMIDERALNRIKKFQVDYKTDTDWKKLLEGDYIDNYVKSFPAVTARYLRLQSFDTDAPTGGPTVREISVGTVFDGNGFVRVPWSPNSDVGWSSEDDKTKKAEVGLSGRWQTTPPKELYLVAGERTIWVCTQALPAQRSLSFRWFQLTPLLTPDP